jgi:anti-anti-sigma factor
MPPDTPGSQPEIDIQSPHAGVVIVALRGEHDLASKAELTAALERARASEPLVVVDLGECSFIDSTVIAAIVSSYARVLEQGRRLALVIPQTDGIVARTAELSGLRALVPTFSSLDEAL